MSFKYTPDMLDFLRQGYKKMKATELTEAFNRKYGLNKTSVAIRSALKARGYTCGRPAGSPKGQGLSMTPQQIEWLREQYRIHPLAELAPLFNARFNDNRSTKQIRAFIHNHGITSGRTGHYQRGETPWNKGTRGVMKPNRTSFAPGTIPPNRKPLGHERIDSKNGYKLIKVAEPNPYTGAPTRYREKHRWLWEQHHGPVPEGHMVIFKDGDQLNCTIDNLLCISKAEHVRLNHMQYRKYPPEIQPVVRTLAKLICKASDVSSGKGQVESGKVVATDGHGKH